MCAPRVNGMITSNGSTHAMYRSAKRGKNREEGGGYCEGCPRKNRKFHRVEIRGEQRGEVDGVKEKGLGRLEAACLQELRVARSRGIHRG